MGGATAIPGLGSAMTPGEIMWKCVATLIGTSMLGAVHAADERNPLEATFILDAGAFLVSTDLRVRVDGEAGERGSDVDFDESLGLDDFDRFRADALWRIVPRHAIRAMYFENNRSATHSIDRDINFRNATFPI